MLFRPSLLVMVTLASAVAAMGDAEPSKYYATFGKYGTFQLEISADVGSMVWNTTLKKLDELATELGVEAGFAPLNYHLHQQWTNSNNHWATGAEGCGPSVTGGHYDPFLACGPASGVDSKICSTLGRERSPDRYSCSGTYGDKEYDRCEVGDLSGKDGPLIVADGHAEKSSELDPLAALDYQYTDDTFSNTPDRWASLVIHNGSPRVLCGKIFRGELPDVTAAPSGAPFAAATAVPTPRSTTASPTTTAPSPSDPTAIKTTLKKGYISIKNAYYTTHGPCLSPVWIGFHDGRFNTSSAGIWGWTIQFSPTFELGEPLPGYMESLVEDGKPGPLLKEFTEMPGAIWNTTIGEGPICVETNTVYVPFEVELPYNTKVFLSYATKVMPSNDAFLSETVLFFDENGEFAKPENKHDSERRWVGVSSSFIFVNGVNVLDAGTEVNDEKPENTAFFGQKEDNTGVDENGVLAKHPGFFKKGSGGILDSVDFQQANFWATQRLLTTESHICWGSGLDWVKSLAKLASTCVGVQVVM